MKALLKQMRADVRERRIVRLLNVVHRLSEMQRELDKGHDGVGAAAHDRAWKQCRSLLKLLMNKPRLNEP